MCDLFSRIAAAPVTPEMIIRANNAAIEAHEATDGKADVMLAILREFGREIDGETLAAIVFRMEAMASLTREGGLHGWTMSVAGQAYELINEAAFIAAAKATLQSRNDAAYFDPQEFLDLALAASNAEGGA